MLSLNASWCYERCRLCGAHRLHDFFVFLGAHVPRGAAEQKWMFPFALQLIGWNHMWDLVIKTPLCHARWWPGFLDSLKAVNSFLRSKTYLPQLIRTLEESGKFGLAELLGKLSLPTFAAWRWRTLEHVCVSLNDVLESLCLHFDPEPFKNIRDGVQFQKVVSALRTRSFVLLFKFVLWLAVWLGSIQGGA